MGEKGNVAASATTIPVTQANRGLGGQLTPTNGFAGGSTTPQPDVRLGTQASSASGDSPLIDIADSARDFALGAVSEAAVERYVDSRDKRHAGDIVPPDEVPSGERQYF